MRIWSRRGSIVDDERENGGMEGREREGKEKKNGERMQLKRIRQASRLGRCVVDFYKAGRRQAGRGCRAASSREGADYASYAHCTVVSSIYELGN